MSLAIDAAGMQHLPAYINRYLTLFAACGFAASAAIIDLTSVRVMASAFKLPHLGSR